MVRFIPLLRLLPFLLAPVTLAANDSYTVSSWHVFDRLIMLKYIKDGAGHPVASPYDYQRAGTRVFLANFVI